MAANGPFSNAQEAEIIRMQLLMDGVHPVYLMVEQSADVLEGKYVFLTSGTEFRLEGFVDGDRWTLTEIDSQGQKSGWISGKWIDRCFYGTWYNRNKSTRHRLAGCDDRVLKAEEDKAYRLFQGEKDGNHFELGVYKLAGEQFKAIYWSVRDNVWASYRGICPGNRCDRLALYPCSPFGPQTPDSLLLNQLNNELEVIFWKEGNPSRTISPAEKLKKPLSVTSYADYYGTFDVVYPGSVEKPLRQKLSRAITKWKNALRARSDSLEQYYGGYAVSRRFSLSAYGWLDIDWWNQNILSGRLHFINSDGTSGVLNFIFDQQNDRIISPNALIQTTNGNLKGQLYRWWHQSVSSHCENRENKYCIWLYETKNIYVGIQPTGLLLTNTFDRKYGLYHSAIPFDELGEAVRRSRSWQQKMRK